MHQVCANSCIWYAPGQLLTEPGHVRRFACLTSPSLASETNLDSTMSANLWPP